MNKPVRVIVNRELVKNFTKSNPNSKKDNVAVMFKDDLITEGSSRRKNSDLLVCDLISEGYDYITDSKGRERKVKVSEEIDFAPINLLFVVNDLGGEVYFYNPYIKVAEANIDDEIPEGLPNRTYTVVIDDSDPDNIITEERVHTWRTWRDENHPLGDVVNGYYYFISNTFFDYLLGSELVLINNATGVEIISIEQYQSEMPVIEI